MIDTDGISAAGTKAIEAGGTNNHLVAKSLVKRGIFEATEGGAFKYMPTAEFLNMQEKAFADAMEAEENAQDDGSHERWAIEQENTRLRNEEIEALSDEYLTADVERCDEIAERLRELGAEPPLVNENPDHPFERYTGKADTIAELVGTEPIKAQLIKTPPNADAALAVAVREDETKAREEILAPVRDPRETRYAHVERWTDDNLEIKYGILSHRLMRRTLRKADRMQAERQCQTVENELLRRGIRPNRNR